MSELNDVNIIQTDGNLGRVALSKDGVCGVILPGMATANIAINDVVVLNSMNDLAGYLIDPAYDSTNGVLVYHHISEIYRKNPGAKVYLGLAATTTTLVTLVTGESSLAQKVLDEAEGEIRILGLASLAASTSSGGLNEDIFNAIPLCQAIADAQFLKHSPISIVIEGKDFNGTATAATDLRTLNAKNVSVVIGQDYDIAKSNAAYDKYAAIGTVLGTISQASVHLNIGWAEAFPLTEAGKFKTASLSSGIKIKDYDLGVLNAKGYIFPRNFVGLAGYFWNDSHTCVSITSDFAYIENNRTIGKAVRELYIAYVPKLNSPMRVDPDSGKLSPETSGNLEGVGRQALNEMLRLGEIDARTIFINPDQNILSSSTLAVEAGIQPVGVGRIIKITIGYENPFNS